jgi:hypothetical protein
MRASQLELTAHHLGYHDLTALIASAAPDRPWQTHWSHGHQATEHQVLTGHDDAVNALEARTLPDGTRSSSAAATTARCGYGGPPTAPPSANR